MPHSPINKKLAVTRVRPIRGQIMALEQALEEESGCANILQRLDVIRGAINGLMTSVLGSYLQEEFQPNEAANEAQQKAIHETISIIRSYVR